MTQHQLQRRIRFLTMYAIAGTLAFLVLAASAFVQPGADATDDGAHAAAIDTLRVKYIQAQRIDIVEPDGRLALVIANTEHMPGAIVRGEELIEHREGRGIAGMLFYNAQGTEMGGLIFHSDSGPAGYDSFGHLSFDQYNQDQVLALNYSGTDTTRAAGLSVWDRPTSVTITEVIEAVLTLRAARQGDAPADSARLAHARDILDRTDAETNFRVFVGSENETAGVHLYDTAGRERIRMVVDSLDRARIVFLDEDGSVVRRITAED